MPYRRLPNTDLARIRAMKAALKKGTLLHPFDLAFSQSLLHNLKTFLPVFEKAVEEQRLAVNLQATKNKDYLNALKKAQMYISHFIQVLNFTIARGELPSKIRKYYGFEISDKRVPSLTTEEELLDLGAKLIKGEQTRTMEGGSPILNPKVSLVSMYYEKFIEACHYQKKLKEASARATINVASLRMKADQLILEIWNEVEKHFETYESDEKRKNSAAYGLVYVYRKTEKKSVESFLQLSA
ncbi:MAG: hypothetical protein U0W24_16865 [Bacteroidales bacterium]